MSLLIMILGLAVFLGVHSFATLRGQRAAVVARLGEWPYKGLFALVSLSGLVLIVGGFARYRAEGLIPGGGRRTDVIGVVVGTLLYLALGFWFHPYVIGLRVFGS
jgi:hypothetical protein